MSTSTPNYPPHQENLHSRPLTIILTVVLVFFLVGFFSVVLCRCFMESVLDYLNLWRTTPSDNFVSNAQTQANNGLDPSIIKSFPTFLYSTVKDLRKEKYGLECAICLIEFGEDSMLRLFTSCCHVFHQECIDLWLESHKTCPVCRRNLDSTPGKSPARDENSPSPSPSTSTSTSPAQNETANVVEEGAISIEIRDDYEGQEGKEGDHSKVEKSLSNTLGAEQGNKEEQYERERFARSHSTGHSIVRIRSEVEDMYTLKLPEHVKAKLIRGHHWTGSCTTFGEMSRNKDCGFREMSGCACNNG